MTNLYTVLFGITFAAILALCSAAPDDEDYIFTSPKSLRIGQNNQLVFQRFGRIDRGKLKVQLYFKKNYYDENETLALESNFKLAKGKKNSTFNIFLDPSTTNNVYSARLQINGTIGNQKFGGSDAVYFTQTKESFILIQTDKPLYKPGQQVLFRVLKLSNHLKPPKEDKVAHIRVEDPKGTLLFQYLDVKLDHGIVQLSFPLADEPVKGTWTITVSNENETDSTSTTFEVKDYTLPKYNVKVTFPPFVLADAEVIPVKICAEYTYGQPVKGHLNLNVSLEKYQYYYYYNSYDSTPTVQISIDLDGCYNYNINVSVIDPNQNRYQRIQVVANVIADGTGVQMNDTEYVSRQNSPLNLDFNSDQNLRQYFKPGLPYNGKLKVTNPDNSPASGEPVQICYTVTHQRIIAGFASTKEVQFCKNFTSGSDGIIRYTIPPQNSDIDSLQLDAKSTKYTSDGVLNIPQTSTSFNPFFSPSGSFIQLAEIGEALPCGAKKSVSLLFTSKHNGNYKFYFQIIQHGKVVSSGIKKVSFKEDDDDVSDRFEDDDQVINESEKRLNPPENSKEKPSKDSEEDCPEAKEANYLPPIGEVTFDVDVESDLSPQFSLLVFYVRKDDETVADSQKFTVEKCFKNEVGFEFGDEAVQPGTNTTVKVTASPNSLCGIKAVDKSVSLLDSSDQLTKDSIFQLLNDLNNDNTYSPDPCYSNAPQPGLSKSAAIILPPGRFQANSYEDSLSSFQDVGLLVISNLVLLTRPCNNDQPIFEPIGPIRRFQPLLDLPGPDGFAEGLAEGAAPRGVPIQIVPASPNSQAPVTTITAVDVRTYFPDTWLFELDNIGPSGESVLEKTLPDTITEWVGSAVCLSSEDGIGLSDTTTIKGFQLFFISYTLPTSAIRGEVINAVVSIFNYADGALPITVSLEDSEQFEVVGDSIDGDICIQSQTSKNLNILLKATTIGKVNITVRAQTAQNSDVCGDSTVYNSFAKDAITQALNVEPEGFPAEIVNSVLFCPSDNANQVYSNSFDLNLPDDVVPDSARAIVDVTGNVLGSALQNLNSLVSVPTGCGEQNMIKFVPNLVVLDYLKDIGKLTDSIKTEAIQNLNTGYQRELTYRHQDGSYSAFGDSDDSGSMFLTAFVLRSFYQSKVYITIDDSVLAQAQKWILDRQRPDGCFPDVGKIIHHDLQGGVGDETTLGPITAYVVASLKIAQYSNQTVINKALKCLLSNGTKNLTPYETFLFAYTEALSGFADEANQLVAQIKPFANTTGGVEYYNNPGGSDPLNLETAAYAVLVSLKTGSSATDVLPIVRYITQSQNSHGGFYSTQDTAVGLAALGEFAKLTFSNPDDLHVSLDGGLQEDIEINEDNKLVVQRNSITTIPSTLTVEATGTGCGLLMTSLRYNTKSAPGSSKFNLKVTGLCSGSACQDRQIFVDVSYAPTGKTAGMSVVQIKMVTGISPDKDSINKLTDDKNILRVDVEDNTVIVYLDEVSNTGTQFSFGVNVVVNVDNPQPGTAKAFDYYAPENSATTSYTFASGPAAAPAPPIAPAPLVTPTPPPPIIRPIQLDRCPGCSQ